MKKTLLITLEYPPIIGGVSRYYQHLVELLPRDRIVVLDNEHNELLSQSWWVWPQWLKAITTTWKAITQYHIEHILVGQILPLGTVALFFRLFRRIPYTIMTHAMDITVPLGPSGNYRKRLLLNLILRYASSVTTVSRFTKERLQHIGVPESRIHIIHPCPHINGLNATIATAANALPQIMQGDRIILSVGRLVERKGFDMIIHALRRINEVCRTTKYVIIGDGPYKKTLERITAQVGVQDNVKFIGQCTDNELAAWYQRCSLFVMPSRELSNNDTEGFGIVYLEANSFGKPVIGSTAGGVSDAVVDGQTGFLVDPEDISMIADACVRLLTNNTLAQRLGENGRQRVQEIFQWNIQAKQLEQLLTTV